jgi:uncharacterized protein
MTDEKKSLLQFPTDFPIKVFGLADDTFETKVLTIITKYAKLKEGAIQTRKSANGKYLAISVTVPVDSQEQLDNIYRELSACPEILMAL